MKANPGKDTGPEVALRSALHRAGLRFRKEVRMVVEGVRVRPDIVFTRAQVAVFVDGCFWHGCPEHGEMPASNREFWEAKIGGNRDRDQRQTAALQDAGWTVLRVWEHESPDDALIRVIAVLADADVVHRQLETARRPLRDGVARTGGQCSFRDGSHAAAPVGHVRSERYPATTTPTDALANAHAHPRT
jgi:DNA mismatch endonuclease (patch repair protein)